MASNSRTPQPPSTNSKKPSSAESMSVHSWLSSCESKQLDLLDKLSHHSFRVQSYLLQQNRGELRESNIAKELRMRTRELRGSISDLEEDIKIGHACVDPIVSLQEQSVVTMLVGLDRGIVMLRDMMQEVEDKVKELRRLRRQANGKGKMFWESLERGEKM
ncbi:hypothetical protein K440DRAFT_643316 [Wilcoxina mikolae CBS 423.85]|nr:hypothetical protein K440DRAFT_643316 [Wilcoxina mikolae CBS 423.85]